MPFNERPLRPIGADDSATHARDGVVCLRNVFAPEWLHSMERPARRLSIDKADFGLLPSNPGRGDDSRYPRGFAMAWAAHRRDEVNQYGKFEQLQADMRKA